MTQSLFASFANINDAERAMGALLDHDVKPKEISLLAHESHKDQLDSFSASKNLSLEDLRDHAESGITTTTSADAEVGALKGATIGMGVGVVATLASIFIPGVGLVIGGGALSLAIAGAAGATGVGAISGGAFGFLKDQGVTEPHLTAYQSTYNSGGAVMSVDISGRIDQADIHRILAKYNAENISEHEVTFS